MPQQFSLPDVLTCVSGSRFHFYPSGKKKNLELGKDPNFSQALRLKEIQQKMYKAVFSILNFPKEGTN